MQYKLSYLLWKAKMLWPVCNVISLYFNLIVALAILAFALYFQLALLWLLYIVIYLVQTWRVHSSHA